MPLPYEINSSNPLKSIKYKYIIRDTYIFIYKHIIYNKICLYIIKPIMSIYMKVFYIESIAHRDLLYTQDIFS